MAETTRSKIGYLAGVFLILAGILIPSSIILDFLIAPSDKIDPEKLLTGATFFRVGLVLLGLFILILCRSGIWTATGSKTSFGDRHTILRMGGLLLLALILRLYGLDQGLWFDEIVTSVEYVRNPLGEIITTYNSENQHFLYAVLARCSILIFGETAWSLRLPAALFGVASLWALFLFARLITSGREAFLAVGLLTFSYYHIWFSQNARGYTGMLFWTILSSWLLVRAIREGAPRLWLSYAISLAFGVYTHATMLFVVAGHFIIYINQVLQGQKQPLKRRWKGFFLGFCFAGILTFQLYAFVVPQISGTINEHATVMIWKNPLWTLGEFIEAMQISFAGSIAAIAAFLIFGAGVWSFSRREPLVIQFLFIPSMIGASVVLGMGHPLWPRFFFFTCGFGVLVVVRGAFQWGAWTGRLFRMNEKMIARLGTAFCCLMILVSALSLRHVYAPKQDFLGARTFVEENREPGDAVVSVGRARVAYSSFYDTGWEEVDSLEALNKIRSRSKRTWLLYIFPEDVQAVYPDIVRSIQSDFRVVQEFYGTLRGGTIYVCRSDAPSQDLLQNR